MKKHIFIWNSLRCPRNSVWMLSEVFFNWKNIKIRKSFFFIFDGNCQDEHLQRHESIKLSIFNHIRFGSLLQNVSLKQNIFFNKNMKKDDWHRTRNVVLVLHRSCSFFEILRHKESFFWPVTPVEKVSRCFMKSLRWKNWIGHFFDCCGKSRKMKNKISPQKKIDAKIDERWNFIKRIARK